MAGKVRNKRKKLTATDYVDLFKTFNKSERLEIAKQINLLTFRQEWHKLSKELPDLEMAEEEIMEEVKAVRYGEG